MDVGNCKTAGEEVANVVVVRIVCWVLVGVVDSWEEKAYDALNLLQQVAPQPWERNGKVASVCLVVLWNDGNDAVVAAWVAYSFP